jgi:formate hydrogenlyase transcriptional activator
MAARNAFRSDLYYRLNVFPIQVPPLRERREDIPALVTHFVKFFSGRMRKQIEQIPPETMAALTSAWEQPGNIRELENFIEPAAIVTRNKSLEAPLGQLGKTNAVESTNANWAEAQAISEEKTNSGSDKSIVADEYKRRQRDEIIRALTASRGRVGGADGAAVRLGVNRTTLPSPHP